jgi:predicted dienelactone hydrolase
VWQDLTVEDAVRHREIPIRVYLPQDSTAAPVVIFSHGLGGSREGSRFLGEHWSARGFACIFLQHPGSDDAVWKGITPAQRMRALRDAADVRNFMLRVGDIPVVLNQLEQWNTISGHVLAGRMDLNRVGMAGHSFGAMTTQAVSGQKFRNGKVSFTDSRIRAAIVMSPSIPRQGANSSGAFDDVKIPWLLMTGTRDVAPIGDADVASRLAVFPALPAGNKYEVVLYNAEHSAFSDRALPGDREARNPNHHRVILALSTAFLETFLNNNAAAKAWLDGPGPRAVLEAQDRWQTK